MTDRYSVLTVALVEDMRDDDLEPVVNAILQLRAVAGVTPGKPVDPGEFIMRSRFRRKLAEQVIDLIIGENT